MACKNVLWLFIRGGFCLELLGLSYLIMSIIPYTSEFSPHARHQCKGFTCTDSSTPNETEGLMLL